jgi:cold shock CspA family protein
VVGTIEFFNNAKGYGFISVDAGGSVFFHCTNLLDKTMKPDTHLVGQRVRFELAPAIAKGKPPQAVNVALLHVTDALGGVR